MAKKKAVRKGKKKPAVKKAVSRKTKKKKPAAAKKKAAPKTKKTPRRATKPAARPTRATARTVAVTPVIPPPPPPPPPFIHIQFPLAGDTVPPTFFANGTAGSVNGVQGTMTSLTTGQSYPGQAIQPPPNWVIEFTNLPAPDDYRLTVNDPVTGASDSQSPIHVRRPGGPPGPHHSESA
jgi:hypothetical protein